MSNEGGFLVPSDFGTPKSKYKPPKGAMKGVREYNEEMEVCLVPMESGRLAIKAFNEGGFNSVQIDLEDVIVWLKKNRPDLLK